MLVCAKGGVVGQMTLRKPKEDLLESVRHFNASYPSDINYYLRPENDRRMHTMMEVSKQAFKNFKTSVDVTFWSRLGTWFRWEIHERIESFNGASFYFEVNRSKVMKSVISIMQRATFEPNCRIPAIPGRSIPKPGG